MVRRLGFALATLLVAVFSFAPVKADVQDFEVELFEASYLITKAEDDVSVAHVFEGITVKFPDFDQNHGILRAIPEKYQGHSLEVGIDGVVDDQRNPIPYETYSENDNLVLKIGDADKFVHGQQKYFIAYHMRGVINKQADRDEFYWNINGTQWQQPFGKVLVYVKVDDPLLGKVPASAMLPEKLCYTGYEGSTTSDCTITETEDGFKFETTRPFLAGENLTVVAGFTKDTFAAYKPSPAMIFGWLMLGVAIAFPPIVALVVVLRNWLRFGRDPEGRGTIVPEYLPPKHESVLASSYVFYEMFNIKSVTATILDLAVRHHLKIYEVKDKPDAQKPSDYEIELVKADGLKAEERKVIDILFGSAASVGTRITLSSKSTKLATQVQKLGKEMDDQVTHHDYFSRSPSKARRPYLIAGVVLLILGFLAFPFTIGLVIAGAILAIAAPAMPARTAKGVELRDYLLGVRNYIKLAEADRLKVLQSPHGSLTMKVNVDDKRQLIKLFERLLPYAILFGLEKDWAKQLAALYEEEKSPTWYSGHSAFNSVYFASAMSGFSTASAATFAPPNSSSGSGFSGGSSGGGGGGGGGGGW